MVVVKLDLIMLLNKYYKHILVPQHLVLDLPQVSPKINHKIKISSINLAKMIEADRKVDLLQLYHHHNNRNL